ncbi:MAG: DEAD/DEAH box helicase family protein [Faecalimonas sp.]|nr:DEAD/DEAH box helicase family protein [Faecalimonas sp.]
MFERHISNKLSELSDNNGWRISKNDDGFDTNTALYMPDFIEYLTETAPEKIEKMQSNLAVNWENNLRHALVKSLEINGTVLTLRKGFFMAGYQNIICSGHYPDDPRLDDQKKFYDKNILRVMHQVHYQTAGNKSLDLVFFINGIPVATAEVKTELTQTVYDAIDEYQKERRPIEPGTKRKNYLLMYKRGAVVHFAISEDEIWMCTNLEPEKPRFLPFNKGYNGHAGNKPKDKESDEYPTSYFWDEICRKDNWIRIFHNFVFEEVERKTDANGKLRESRIQIFPRFHQWDVVTKCMDDVRKKGVGQKYLIEHSAGSGKTETITWLAHELIRQMNKNSEKLFSSVIVVTDRIGLDTNIKNTITQLKKTVGLIEMIGGDGMKKISVAKKTQLANALHDKREIIVVTLQTFPHALDSIAADESLVDANFAVIIDEAHSSQNGVFSSKMKAALKAASKKTKKKYNDDEITDEDLIDAYFQEMQDSKQMPDNVSFFAFTATPKTETKNIFGRPGDKTDSKTGEPLPESFHLYPMRQAIEEGYILDVLKGYMPYKTAYKLKEDIVKDYIVDERAALRTIAQWESLHPINVMSKAELIVEHFIKNVSVMLGGQAKAMIVTFSRASVVRYKYAIDAYLNAHPEYQKKKVEERLQFKVPGEPLVAFSGKVKGEQAIMTEDANFVSETEYLKENPFAAIKRDYDYTEDNINNLGYSSIEEAFDSPQYRMMIVANKFQTGFNQPKLCAMYIDKKISNDIEVVQTYSRLNRTYPGKDHVYILDFVNDPETIVTAFKKYDKGAEMEHAQNLNIIYEVKTALDQAGIYTDEEFQVYKKVYYKSMSETECDKEKQTYRVKLFNTLAKPALRWNDALKTAQEDYQTWHKVLDSAKHNGDEKIQKQVDQKLKEIQECMDKLMDFRQKLKKYCSAYNYIAQIVDLGDPDLEVFHGFAKLLTHRIKGTPLEEIDVSNLVLANYRINPVNVPNVGENDNLGLKPMRAGGKGKASKKESLKVIISRINEIFGEDVSTVTGARTINALADCVAADDMSRIQIQNSTNSKEAVIADGRMGNIIKQAALVLKNNEFEELIDKVLTDSQAWRPLAEIIYEMIDKNKRVDIQELASVLKKEN